MRLLVGWAGIPLLILLHYQIYGVAKDTFNRDQSIQKVFINYK